MPTFINQTTGEYPRYPGDVALEPDADWAEVVQTPEPDEEAGEGLRWIEDTPQQVDGVWERRWTTAPIIPDLYAIELQKAIDAGINIEILGLRR